MNIEILNNVNIVCLQEAWRTRRPPFAGEAAKDEVTVPFGVVLKGISPKRDYTTPLDIRLGCLYSHKYELSEVSFYVTLSHHQMF